LLYKLQQAYQSGFALDGILTLNNDLKVAVLGAAHVLPYRALMLQAYALAADAFTSTVDERAAQPVAWWEKRIASPDGQSQCFGAFDVGDLVGTVALEYSPRAKTQHAALVIGMYVKAEARRKGAGLLLMQAAIAAASARPNLRQLRLTVTEGNDAAIRLYQSVGFVAWGTEPMAIHTSTGYKAKVHMALVLNDGASMASMST
jgi:RimJ/RimL family protein N-acetyltransferase